MTGSTKTVLVIAALPFVLPILMAGVLKVADGDEKARERAIKSLPTDKLLAFRSDPATNAVDQNIARLELERRGIR